MFVLFLAWSPLEKFSPAPVFMSGHPFMQFPHHPSYTHLPPFPPHHLSIPPFLLSCLPFCRISNTKRKFQNKKIKKRKVYTFKQNNRYQLENWLIILLCSSLHYKEHLFNAKQLFENVKTKLLFYFIPRRS